MTRADIVETLNTVACCQQTPSRLVCGTAMHGSAPAANCQYVQRIPQCDPDRQEPSVPLCKPVGISQLGDRALVSLAWEQRPQLWGQRQAQPPAEISQGEAFGMGLLFPVCDRSVVTWHLSGYIYYIANGACRGKRYSCKCHGIMSHTITRAATSRQTQGGDRASTRQAISCKYAA